MVIKLLVKIAALQVVAQKLAVEVTCEDKRHPIATCRSGEPCFAACYNPVDQNPQGIQRHKPCNQRPQASIKVVLLCRDHRQREPAEERPVHGRHQAQYLLSVGLLKPP